MNIELINKYGEKLCEEIKSYYLKEFSRCRDTNKWFSMSEEAVRNFILSRHGWQKSDPSNEMFVFLDKYHITVNQQYNESTAMLMINTAIEIGKAELISEFDQGGKKDSEDVAKIVACIKNQDWMIPFMRKKK